MTAELTFHADVVDALARIIREYGYRVIQSDDSSVRLDSGNSSIQVQYDRHRSFEVGVSFSEHESGILLRRIPLSLGEVFREFGVPEAEKRCFLQTSDPTEVRDLLTATCNLLLDHCRPIVRGDRAAFVAVSERRSREAESYTQQLQIAAVRKQADEAWRSKRYEEFVNLLGEFRSGLSGADQKKLDYAARRGIDG